MEKIYYQEKDENSMSEFAKFYSKLEKYDCPDYYSIIKNDVLIFEHFEFDSSNHKRKGSTYRKKLASIEADKDLGVKHFELPSTLTSKNYVNNLTRSFEEHYKKIELYKKNIAKIAKSDGDINFKVCFFIQDVTPLGNYSNDNNKPLTIFDCKQFLDLFENSPDLDWVLFYNKEIGYEEITWFLSRDSLSEYRKNELDFNKVHFINRSPQCIQARIMIDKK
ncbi:MAG: hypothetical protein Q8865_05420 [Bacillota bacterium]|nr:hypothetical protein [Bacillota bacterium]